jgi:excinuclease ABC subunit C
VTQGSPIHIAISGESVSLQEKLEHLPTSPGVYQFKDAGSNLLYVGKAVNLRNRVRQYFHKSRATGDRIGIMVGKATDLEIIVTDTEVEALILEANLVKSLKPKYNVSLKDDKSFPYIVVTNEPFPRIFVTRRIIRDGSRYFGPFTDVGSMRASLKMVREIYRVRSCNYLINEESIRKKKIRLCLDYHIKKCDGPCEGLISREHYNAMINEVVLVLKGKTGSLVDSLTEQMDGASAELRYEAAAVIRDRIRQLSVYNERQKVVDEDRVDRDLFAIAVEGDDGCGVVFHVRDGKIVGRRHLYMTSVEERPEPELIEQFLQRFYLESEDIPGEIFLPVEPEHPDVLSEWLGARRGGKVDIVVPKIGEKARLIGMCTANARFLLDEIKVQRLKRADYVPHAVQRLQKDLRLPALPRRIECFDISNIQGSDSVASMVVFLNGKARKSDYRKFRIRSVQGPDDFASMREVIERRYSRLLEEGGELPDLIMVDGGKGQLSSAHEVIDQLGERNADSSSGIHRVPMIGLAKRLEEVYVPGMSEPITIPKASPGLKLLQQIRDEAHRFAITYHREVRSRRTLQTELDLIKGVGKKRAKELLEAFGSVQGVKFATVDQLGEIVGESVAHKILDYFSDMGIAEQNSVAGES